MRKAEKYISDIIKKTNLFDLRDDPKRPPFDYIKFYVDKYEVHVEIGRYGEQSEELSTEWKVIRKNLIKDPNSMKIFSCGLKIPGYNMSIIKDSDGAVLAYDKINILKHKFVPCASNGNDLTIYISRINNIPTVFVVSENEIFLHSYYGSRFVDKLV